MFFKFKPPRFHNIVYFMTGSSTSHHLAVIRLFKNNNWGKINSFFSIFWFEICLQKKFFLKYCWLSFFLTLYFYCKKINICVTSLCPKKFSVQKLHFCNNFAFFHNCCFVTSCIDHKFHKFLQHTNQPTHWKTRPMQSVPNSSS